MDETGVNDANAVESWTTTLWFALGENAVMDVPGENAVIVGIDVSGETAVNAGMDVPGGMP